MHRFTVLSACLSVVALGLVPAGGARASDSHAHTFMCSYDTHYDVQIEPRGIAFTRDNGSPKDIFIHDGTLRVDGRNTPISAADATRLREYEQQVRELVPVMAAMARDGVNIAYSALATVAATLAHNSDERTRWMQELHDTQLGALQQINDGLDKGFWKEGENSDAFGRELQQNIADVTGDVTRDVVSDALSGDPSKWVELQARTQSLETTIQKAVDDPADKLSRSAEALCPRLTELDRLQQQFEFRLANGERLQILSPDTESLNKAGRYAQR